MWYRSLLRRPFHLLLATVERLWRAACWLLARLRPAAARAWTTPGGQRALVIAPHPDDEAIGCGAAIVRHMAAGDHVLIVFITDGRRSRALGLGPEAMAQRRRREAAASAAILGASWEWLGLPEGEWASAELAERLGQIVRRERPDLIYGPSRVDFHPEHRRVAQALAAALGATVAAPRVRVVQLHVPLTSALTNLVCPAGTAGGQANAALRAHASQWGSVARALRMRRYSAARYGLPGEAEEFWELGAAAYQALHQGEPTGWAWRCFYGVRMRPWSDPLAYLRGRAERQRLRVIADGH
jgi:LmbE family N-acetylglucosaminyl deacetylase